MAHPADPAPITITSYFKSNSPSTVATQERMEGSLGPGGTAVKRLWRTDVVVYWP